MGLDVMKYRVITDKNIIDALKVTPDDEFSDHYSAISYLHFKICYRCKRVDDLFERFKEHTVQKIDNNFYDFDRYRSEFGISCITGATYLPEDELYSDDRKSFLGRVGVDVIVADDFDPSKEFYVFTDGIKTIYQNKPFLLEQTDLVLYVEKIDYQRKCHHLSLYDKFLGSCWYEYNNSELPEDHTRPFVYPEELAELKEHFEDCGPIQKWKLSELEFIYMSA